MVSLIGALVFCVSPVYKYGAYGFVIKDKGKILIVDISPGGPKDTEFERQNCMLMGQE